MNNFCLYKLNIQQMNTIIDGVKNQKSIMHGKWRICLAILAVLVCSFNIYFTTDDTLKHSRDLHRALNKQILLHDDLDIYWFGYRVGQRLISYPIQQYYFPQEFSQFLKRMENMMRNLQSFSFGFLNQTQLNLTIQRIVVKNNDGEYSGYSWTIKQGIKQPFESEDVSSIKQILVDCEQIQITVQYFKMSDNQDLSQPIDWKILYIIQPYSQTSIFVSIFLHQKLYLGIHHIPHFIVGIATAALIINEIRRRPRKRTQTQEKNKQSSKEKQSYYFSPYKFDLQDIPDLLICFFLIYSSFASFTNMFTVRYILLLDGVTCFICWLYILKLYTQNDDYHVSFLIRKSYALVGRLFASFGPVFIGFCLFALTVFSRYSILFDSIHKTFISIFCVCYYNMTYEQFRTTERRNPISTIFFSLLVMLFTVCIYSGMLVSVFCSYMWNKREKKIKQQLLQSLNIQCASCNNKYLYAQGYQTSVKMSVFKKVTQSIDHVHNPHSLKKFRAFVRETTKAIEKKIEQILSQSKKHLLVLSQNQQLNGDQIQNHYGNDLKSLYKKIQNLKNQLDTFQSN